MRQHVIALFIGIAISLTAGAFIVSAQGAPVFYPDDGGPHYVIDIDDGCAEWDGSVLTSTEENCGGGGGSASGPDGSIQFSTDGAFASDEALLWDNNDKILTVTGTVAADCILVDGNCLQNLGGTATEIPFFDAGDLLTTNSNFTYSTSTQTLTVFKVQPPAGAGAFRLYGTGLTNTPAIEMTGNQTYIGHLGAIAATLIIGNNSGGSPSGFRLRSTGTAFLSIDTSPLTTTRTQTPYDGDGRWCLEAVNCLATTSIDTSIELASILTDETGSGSLVFGTSAALSSTTLGASTTLEHATATKSLATSLLRINSENFTDLTGTGLGFSAGALNCLTATASQQGCLTGTDWSTFNNKISSTSLSVTDTATLDLTYTSGTGVFTGLVVAGSIGDTQLAFKTGQNLTTTSDVLFAEATTTQFSTLLMSATTSTSTNLFSQLARITNGTSTTWFSSSASSTNLFANVVNFANGALTNVGKIFTAGTGSYFDFSNAIVKQKVSRSFSWPGGPSMATTTTATTTLWLGNPTTNEQYVAARCKSLATRSVGFRFTDGSSHMDFGLSTTTLATTTISTNNTLSGGTDSAYVEIGPMTNGNIACTVEIIVN